MIIENGRVTAHADPVESIFVRYAIFDTSTNAADNTGASCARLVAIAIRDAMRDEAANARLNPVASVTLNRAVIDGGVISAGKADTRGITCRRRAAAVARDRAIENSIATRGRANPIGTCARSGIASHGAVTNGATSLQQDSGGIRHVIAGIT